MKKKKQIRKTVLFVGEGLAEKNFLLHMRPFFANGSHAITIKSAGGKGPHNVINDAIQTWRCVGYDHCAILLDTDLPWPAPLVREAKDIGVILIGATPCIEGLLLNILGKRVPLTSKECKASFEREKFGALSERVTYEKFITEELVNIISQNNQVVQSVQEVMSGKAFI